MWIIVYYTTSTIRLDLRWVQHHSDSLAHGLSGEVALELGPAGSALPVGLDDLAPDDAGVGWLVLAGALRLVLALVDVGDLLAEVPRGLPPGEHSLYLDQGLVLMLVAETSPVTSENTPGV